ncbi:hypothetical protein GOP47_0002884 [Adiantum capillus-veneris]|uniref:Synergin gamma C-terminal domain-containing protein n=1 Tax=Adiantum capillus-veneris TaxID=13818 RepID=A0A9D4ZRC0_ADICA|nr:hypothetical protein GOP47_0002884 [Adiantum capillus-veneris]
MDSDDDFGDFTFVAAEVKDVPVPFEFPVMNTSNELDVGTSFNSPKAHLSAIAGTTSSTIKPVESNSDDDWGDFVEHSSSEGWDKTLTFDWFTTTPHGAGQNPPSEAFTAANNPSSDWKDGFWIGPSEVQVQHTEQKTDDLGFAELHFSTGTGTSNLKGSGASLHATGVNSNDIAQQATFVADTPVSEQEIEIPGRSVSREINSPIPLSLFGDTELEAENGETQLLDPAPSRFQGHTGKVVGTSSLSSSSKELSNLIANLYAEAQPLSNAQNTNNVPLNELENSMGYQSSAAGASYDLEKSMLTLNLGLEYASETGSSKGDSGIPAGAALQLEEATTSFRLDSLSEADRFSFVEAWASILAVCASELELALDIWKQARVAGVHLALLADLQGKRYFAAIGQIYIVALILAATSNVYKAWLQVATKKGESLCADLERCKAVWLETDLKEGVRLALDGLEGFIPTSVVSWKGIERFSGVALEAYLQAASTSDDSICEICLLPMASFSCTGLHLIEWSGSNYLLPLANLWANCISQELPTTCLST